jgi:hypothetical protein
VCRCYGPCRGSCKEDCKQKIINDIKEISPMTVTLADRLIHCVNPTLIWDRSDNVTRQIPSEWTNMEKYLRTFVYNQFHFHKLFSITTYLQMLMHDAMLLSQLNIADISSKIERLTGEVLQFQSSIGQLEDLHDKAYIEARNKINDTITVIRTYILQKMNDLKRNPEKLISREMIRRLDPKTTEADLHRLIQSKLKEVEGELNQTINVHVQNCAYYIYRLVEGLPKSSTHKNFDKVKELLQKVDLDAYGFRKPEKSFKHRVQKVMQQALSNLGQDSIQTWSGITYRASVNVSNQYIGTYRWPTMDSSDKIYVSSENTQESR